MSSLICWILGCVVVLVASGWMLVRAIRTRSPAPWLVVTLLVLPLTVVLASGLRFLAPGAHLPFSVDHGPLVYLPFAIAVLLLWLRGDRLAAGLSRRRGRAHAVLVGTMLGILALLLGNAQGLVWRNDQVRLVVWDISRSAERAGVTMLRRDAELRLAERGMHDGDRLGVVEVGGHAELAIPLHRPGQSAARIDVALPRDSTDLEAGIRRALAELPADVAAKLVLVSDGIENRGDVLRTVSLARTRGIPIDTVLLDYAPPPDLELHAVRAPARAALGQPFDLRIETSAGMAGSDGPIAAELVLERDGVPWQRRAVRLAAGHDVVQIPIDEPEAGFHRYSAELRSATGNEIHDNDKKTAFVDVTGPRTALVISGVLPGPSPVEGWLRDAGFQVKHAGPADRLDDVADLAARDLVVLEDVAAETLGEARIRALARAVTDVGTGLLLVGGKHAFGPGGYAGSPLEAVSPVSFDLKKDKNRPSLAEVIVIDYSGSMSAVVDGQTKIALANEAAARSAALLSPGDRLAVAHVDTEVKWTVPLAEITDGKALGPKIRSVDAGGGGIYTQLALEAAYAALRDVPRGTLKHVLLFADGDDAEQIAACPQLAAAAATDDITTSVVSLGRGSDSTMLERTSARGTGRFYLVEDARTLPEVFSQETVLASRRAFREEHVIPHATSDSSYLRGVTGLPALEGYVVTTTKPGARLSLVGMEDEPLVADWTRGLGKVGVITTDLAGRWSAPWLTNNDAIRMTAQLALSLARSPPPPGAHLAANVRRGELTIEATDSLGAANGATLIARVLSPDGTETELDLEEISRGGFQGRLRSDRAGTHVVTLLRRKSASGPDALQSDQLLGKTAVVLGSSDELAPRPSNKALLERISVESGGTVRATLEGLFAGERSFYTIRSALSPILLPLLVGLLVAVVAVRRLILPTRGARAFVVAGPTPESPALRLARRAKAERPVPRAPNAPHVPIVAVPPRATQPSPIAQPAEPPVPAERELTAVERIARRRRDTK